MPFAHNRSVGNTWGNDSIGGTNDVGAKAGVTDADTSGEVIGVPGPPASGMIGSPMSLNLRHTLHCGNR
jgi:hypothetical protein